MSEKICGECKWHYPADVNGNWCCCNKDSDYYTDFTDYTDTCEEWSERGTDNE